MWKPHRRRKGRCFVVVRRVGTFVDFKSPWWNTRHSTLQPQEGGGGYWSQVNESLLVYDRQLNFCLW